MEQKAMSDISSEAIREKIRLAEEGPHPAVTDALLLAIVKLLLQRIEHLEAALKERVGL